MISGESNLERVEKISNGLDQQSIRALRCIHQKPEIAQVAGQQDIGLTADGGSEDGPVFLGQVSWARQ